MKPCYPRPLFRTSAALLPAFLAAALITGCSSSPDKDSGSAGDLTVLASASLTETFTEIGKRFEATHPSTHVRFSFAAGSTLANQIIQGAPADVFASASPEHMARIVGAGKAGGTTIFARNTLTVAVPADNPGKVTSLKDLADPDVSVAVCIPKSPCGTLASQVFARAGLHVVPVTQEVDVKATLRKVVLGEVDAGLVYVTDVKASADKVRAVMIPAEYTASTDYPIGVLKNSSHPQLAQAFVDEVLSDEGKSVLTAAGFSQPVADQPATAPGTSSSPSGSPVGPGGPSSPPARTPRRPSRGCAARNVHSRRRSGTKRGRCPRGALGGAPRRSVRAPAHSACPVPLSSCAVVAAVFLVLPLLGLLLGTPWKEFPQLIADQNVRQALQLSLTTATAATVISLLLGVPLAWVLARSGMPGIRLLRAVVTLPLVLPPVVGGVALLMVLGRSGLVGRHVDSWFHITFPFTTAGVVLAETFVAMPFLVVTVEGALQSVDRGVEEAAATLGAPPATVFRRITLPLVAPSLVAGGILCWTRALGEFGATITFAGNFPGTTQTMPLAVYLALENDPDAAVALSVVLLGTSLLTMVLLRDRWLRPGTD